MYSVSCFSSSQIRLDQASPWMQRRHLDLRSMSYGVCVCVCVYTTSIITSGPRVHHSQYVWSTTCSRLSLMLYLPPPPLPTVWDGPKQMLAAGQRSNQLGKRWGFSFWRVEVGEGRAGQLIRLAGYPKIACPVSITRTWGDPLVDQQIECSGRF